MFNLKPTYPIAVDIGNENISMVQLKETRQGLAVRGWGCKQFEDGIPAEMDTMVPILKKMVKNGQFVGKRAVVQIPSKEISSFPISFEVGETESLESVIVRESQEHIPFPINEACIDYLSSATKVDGGGNHYKATVIAVHRDLIKQYLLMMKQVGLSVEIIDFELSSLVRLHQYFYNSIIDPILLCHIGNTESLLSIVSTDSVLAQRYVQWGMDPAYRKLETNLGLSEDKKAAGNLLKKYGLIYEDRERNNIASPHEKAIASPHEKVIDGPHEKVIDCLHEKVIDGPHEKVIDGPHEKAIDGPHEKAIDSRSRATYQITVPYINGLIYEFQKLIGYVRSNDYNTIIKGIYIYGQASLIRNMDKFFEGRLNIPTKLINPLERISFSGDGDSTLSTAGIDLPISLALGLAMRKVTWL